MRLFRVRFTVGTLHFGVAVVAGNCCALRLISDTLTGNCCVVRSVLDTETFAGGTTSEPLAAAAIGALPLVNVALVGAWLFVVKQLRSRRRGQAGNGGWTPSGLTYFSLHFLALGALIVRYAPDAIDRAEEVSGAAAEYAAQAYGTVFGDAGGNLQWDIIVCLILGIVVSGPPLLVSCMGQVLATRCAATRPRRRFQAMIALVSLGFASAGLAIGLTPRPLYEKQSVVLDFQVVDRVSRRPIAGAFVWLTDPFALRPPRIRPTAFTGADGRARLTDRFVVCGERNAFVTMGAFSRWGRWLEVSAAGHRTRRVALPEVLGAWADPCRPAFGRVALDRGDIQEDAFEDLAGTFLIHRGPGGGWFKIEPDGRFAWCASGCTWLSKEYGYAKRHVADIDLVPVRHPGEEIHPAVTWKYRAIAWGDRLYLAVADERELHALCRRAVMPNVPWHSPWVDPSYLRESDREKPQRGLPRLPPIVWVRFLASELSMTNPEGTLLPARDYILQTILNGGRPPTSGLRL